MTKLHISADVDLPDTTATSTIAVLGGKGMGKTNLDAVLAEELYAAKDRFCWVDPIGVAWSLQHGASKAEPGLEVLVLGGIHGDIAIEPTAGAIVADLVVDHDVSTVIDISRRPVGTMWTHGEQIRFVADFMTRLYERQGERRRRLHVIFDEIGRFAPQTIPSGAIDIAKCLGALEQVMELGRNVGIGMTISTQRSARVSKSLLELADALFAFRTVGPLSVKAVTDWLSEKVDKKQVQIIVDEVRSLPIGNALLVSPGWLRLEKVVAVRKRATFDASATPTGKGSRAPGRARKPDLAKYRALMAATIEQAKASDPRELQKTIVTLRKELEQERRRQPAPAKTETKTVEKYVLKDGQLARVEKLVERGYEIASRISVAGTHAAEIIEKQTTRLAGDVGEAIRPLAAAVSMTKSAPSAPLPNNAPGGVAARSNVGSNGGGAVRAGHTRQPERAFARPATADEPRVSSGAARTPERAEGITARQQRFLDAAATLAALGVTTDRETVSAWLGIHPRGGSVGEELKALAAAGYITMDRSAITLTAEGIAAANPVDQFDAVEQAKAGLAPRQRRILDIVAEAYPESIARDAIAERMTLHPRGGSFGEDLGRLRGRGLVTIDRGDVRARDFLFAGSVRAAS